MKTLLSSLIFLFSISVFAQQMPMPALKGTFTFHGDCQVSDKVRTIYISKTTKDIAQLVKKHEAEGYNCELLDNEDYECGRNEAANDDDMYWVSKAGVENINTWLQFDVPTAPPELTHDYGGATVWSVTQDVHTSNKESISEVEYHFSSISKGISFFDIISSQHDFEIVSSSSLRRDMSYGKDENGTHLDVTVGCLLETGF